MSYPYFNLPHSPFKSYEAFVDGSNGDRGFQNSSKNAFKLNETMEANPKTRSDFVFFQEHGQNLDTRAKDAMRDTFENHDLAQLYFGKENIQRIQKQLKKEFYIRTKGAFLLETDQDDNDLLIAMRAVYYEHSKFRSNKLVQQVKDLNRMSIEYMLPDMISQAKQEYEYLREINRPLQPIARPINVHSGKQILPPMTDRFK